MPPETPLPTRYPNSIRKYRKRCGLKVREVALLMGLKSASHVSRWEKGLRPPNRTNTLRLAAVLNIPPHIILWDEYERLRLEVASLMKKHGIKRLYRYPGETQADEASQDQANNTQRP